MENYVNYVKDGKLYTNATTTNVMVSAESDLPELVNNLVPGSIAYLPGHSKTWQLDSSGMWIEMNESSGGGGGGGAKPIIVNYVDGVTDKTAGEIFDAVTNGGGAILIIDNSSDNARNITYYVTKYLLIEDSYGDYPYGWTTDWGTLWGKTLDDHMVILD